MRRFTEMVYGYRFSSSTQENGSYMEKNGRVRGATEYLVS